ncbi:hypothetical protein ABT352_15485 [Streptosporangium sp. NPDC000563]|uniref:hypothetical protein n=1 Tax=Streptosporangium sp. NPDC000563 TaxID=3154366 RepID=UPI003323B66A
MSLYRTALRLRRDLQCDESIEWIDLGEDIIAFRRANGWTSITNFSHDPVRLPEGSVLISTQPVTTDNRRIPGNATAWLRAGTTAA